MNSKYLFSSSNSVDYSSVDYSSPNPSEDSYHVHTNSAEHHLWSFSNTKLQMSNLGVDNGTSNAGQAGGSNAGHAGGTNAGQAGAGGSNAGHAGGTNAGQAGGTNAGQAGAGGTNAGQAGAGGSNAGQAGGSNAGQLSRPKPRGRPRGSKNKRNVINMTSPVNSAVIQIPPGFDVIEWVKQFAQSRNCFVNVLSGFGTISQVAYSQMLGEHFITLSETLTLLSFTGMAGLVTSSERDSYSFTATLARLNGFVIGGVLSKLVAMEPVVLNVLISENPEVVTVGYFTMA